MKLSVIRRSAVIVSVLLAGMSQVQAHLMVAQRGTLNWKGDNMFIVLSLPVSAFNDVDNNEDGILSLAEYNEHRTNIASRVSESVTLQSGADVLKIEGLLLSPVTQHHENQKSADQLVVMGKFSVAKLDAKARLHIDLYGVTEKEQSFVVTLTKADGAGEIALALTLDKPSAVLSNNN